MATLDIIGVVEDGTPRNEALVPFNPRRTIRCVKGDTLILRLMVRNAAGVPIDLSPGTRNIVWTIKKHSEDLIAVASITAEKLTGQPGRAILTLPAPTFQLQPPGRYVYDIHFLDGSKKNSVVPLSPFIIEPTVLPAPSS